MSSVVNKSKNKFVPKAKARPRLGTAQAAFPVHPVPVPTASPSKHIEGSITVAVPKPSIPELQEKTPTLAPIIRAERQLQREERVANQPGLPGPPRGGVPTLRTVTPVAIHSTRTAGEENHTEPRPHGATPALRTVNNNKSHTGSATCPQSVPTIRSSSGPGIPTIRSSVPEVPAIRSAILGKEPTTENPQPAKAGPNRTRDKRKEPESEVTGEQETQEVGSEEGEAWDSMDKSGSLQKPKKKPTPKRKAKALPSSEPPTKRKAPANKKRIVAEASGWGDGMDQPLEGERVEGNAGGAPTAPKASKKKRVPIKAKPKADRKPKGTGKPRGRRRAESPEDGESQEIAVSVVKMKDLCRDMRIGKKSKRFLELQQMDWKKAVKEQQERAEAEERIANGEEEGEHETVEERLERLANERDRRTMNAPQMRIVNGQIVLDDESLQIDRRERDAVDEGFMEVVEENQNSRLVNSQTWSKREKVEKWDAAATEKFYEALSMFGTDFEIISRMFAGRSRRQMRNKFNNEERKHPEKITAALRTRISVNIEEYSQMADQVFQDPQDLEDELQQLREAHEADEVAAAGHAMAMEKERQEAANAAMYEGDNAAAAEQGKKTRKKKGAKGKASAGPDEEVLTMTREEYEAERLRELAEADDL